MLTLCIAGQETHSLPIRSDGVEELRSRGCHPKRGTDLPPEPLARCCQERVEIWVYKTDGRFVGCLQVSDRKSLSPASSHLPPLRHLLQAGVSLCPGVGCSAC